jgi:hypothetical protein
MTRRPKLRSEGSATGLFVPILAKLAALTGTALALPPTCSNADLRANPSYSFQVGSASWSSASGDSESGSLFRWLRNGSPISPATAVGEGLLLHFDGSDGGANGEIPSFAGSVAYGAGRFGQCLELPSTGGLRFPRSDNFDPAAGAVEMWVALQLPGSDPVYSIRDHVLFRYRAASGEWIGVVQSSSGVLYAGGTVGGQWESAYSSAASTRLWGAGEWHHVVFTFSVAGNFMRFYLDGVLVADTNEGHYQAPPTTGAEISIGSAAGQSAAAYRIDELRLSTRIPSDAEIASRARPAEPPRSNEVWLPVSSLTIGDQISFEFTPVASGSNAGAPCTSATFSWNGIPIVDAEPPSTLLVPGSTSLPLSVTTADATSCRWSVGSPLPFASMTPFAIGSGTTSHQTTVTGLDPSPLVVNHVYVRSASHPDFLLELLYRSLASVNPRFPRTGNLWGWWNFESKTLAEKAKIDLWLGADIPAAEANALRTANPDVLILSSINAIEREGLSDDFYLKDANGNRIEVWPGSYRLNLTKGYVADAQAAYAYQKMLDGSLVWDGMFFDNVMTTQSWLQEDIWGNPVEIDADEDGIADDPDLLDAAWKAGVFREMNAFRALMPGAIVDCHSADIHEPGVSSIFNGNSLGFLTGDVLEGERSFLDGFTTYDDWCSLAVSPRITMVESSPIDMFAYGYDYEPLSKVPPETLEFVRTFFPWMRFGLGLTLMNDGYFAHEWGDTDHGQDWWYEELDFDLGFPLGPASRIDLGGGGGPNRIVNPGFESAISSPWSFWVDTASGYSATLTRDLAASAEGSASARIDVAAAPGADWRIELAQRDRPVELGALYDVTFWAKADRNRTITLGSAKGSAPWTDYGLSATVSIDATWREYTVSFEATATASDARLQFQLGESVGSVWLDFVRWTLHPPDLFRRDYTNGIAILNGTRQPLSTTVGAGFRRLPGSEAPLFQEVLDDDGAGFSTIGSWTTATYDSGEWKALGPFFHDWGDLVHRSAGTRSEARWSLPIPATDVYTVEAWWPASPEAGGWSAATSWEIVSGGRIVTSATLDQSSGGDRWHLVGQALLAPSGSPYVRLVCSGSAPCIADAIAVRSLARYNDGSPAPSVRVGPLDAVVLRRDPDPTTELWASAGTGAILCPGESVILGDSPTAYGGTAPYVYSWSPSTGLDDPGSANPTASPAIDTTYTLTVSDAGWRTKLASVPVAVLPSGPAADPGGSLRLEETANGLHVFWSPTGAFGYDLLSSPQPGFGSPGTIASQIPEGATWIADPALGSGGIAYFRISALGCHH